MAVTTNQEIGNTYELVATGPTTVNKTIEAAVKELEILITDGIPSESLRGHRLRPANPRNISLESGEFLYCRAYGKQGLVTAVLT